MNMPTTSRNRVESFHPSPRVPICAIALLFALSTVAAQPLEFKIENPQSGYPPGRMGESVAIDGDTMVAGAPRTDPFALEDAGAAYVYVKVGGTTWTLQAELTAPDAVEEARFGASVAIQGDTIVVGAPDGDGGTTGSGTVYVFVRDGGTSWTFHSELIVSDPQEGDELGTCVAVTTDTIVLGADWDDDKGSASGSVYVFVRDGGSSWTQQAKLTADDGELGDHFGRAVAAWGDTILVGAPYDDHNSMISPGSVYFFTRDGGSSWTQSQKLIDPDGADVDFFGAAVALTGNIAVIGSPYDDAAAPLRTSRGTNDDAGSFSIAVDTAGNGHYEIKYKLANTEAGTAGLGYRVACAPWLIRDDPPTYVAAASMTTMDLDDAESTIVMAVYINQASSVTQTTTLTASSGTLDPNSSDFSVAISNNQIVAGTGGGFTDSLGLVLPFDYGTPKWQINQAIDGKRTVAGNDRFGTSVDILGDTVAIGVPGDSDTTDGAGAVRMYERAASIWMPGGALNSSLYGPKVSAAGLGSSVRVTPDGLVTGAPGYDNGGVDAGAVHFFTYANELWTETEIVTAPEPKNTDYFGSSLGAYTGSGRNQFGLGAPGNRDGIGGIGHIRIQYDYGASIRGSATRATHETTLTPSDGALGDRFGSSVACAADTIVVGAELHDGGAANAGAAYVFAYDGISSWTQQTKLAAPAPESNDRFGCAGAISSNTIIVGASGDSDGGSDSGAAYVFVYDGISSWTLQQKLTAPTPEAGDFFGSAVAIENDTIAIGTYGDNNAGDDSGAVYVFTRAGATWTLTHTLEASDAAPGDRFGYAIAIANQHVIVGAPHKNDPEFHSGAAYLFDLNTTTQPGTPPAILIW